MKYIENISSHAHSPNHTSTQGIHKISGDNGQLEAVGFMNLRQKTPDTSS